MKLNYNEIKIHLLGLRIWYKITKKCIFYLQISQELITNLKYLLFSIDIQKIRPQLATIRGHESIMTCKC